MVYAPVMPPGYCKSIVLSLLNSTPPSLLKFGLFASTFIVVSLLQLLNATLLMFATLFGMFIEVSSVQPPKA
jgi:hypothetical protein